MAQAIKLQIQIAGEINSLSLFVQFLASKKIYKKKKITRLILKGESKLV